MKPEIVIEKARMNQHTTNSEIRQTDANDRGLETIESRRTDCIDCQNSR